MTRPRHSKRQKRQSLANARASRIRGNTCCSHRPDPALSASISSDSSAAAQTIDIDESALELSVENTFQQIHNPEPLFFDPMNCLGGLDDFDDSEEVEELQGLELLESLGRQVEIQAQSELDSMCDASMPSQAEDLPKELDAMVVLSRGISKQAWKEAESNRSLGYFGHSERSDRRHRAQAAKAEQERQAPLHPQGKFMAMFFKTSRGDNANEDSQSPKNLPKQSETANGPTAPAETSTPSVGYAGYLSDLESEESESKDVEAGEPISYHPEECTEEEEPPRKRCRVLEVPARVAKQAEKEARHKAHRNEL
ncbi:hypothetical protein F5890DRAFT_1560747, partial [Lentinula detonsa]